LAFGGLVCGVELLIRLRKGSQQMLELRERQARESQKLSAVVLECFVCDHAFILFLIPDKVYSLFDTMNVLFSNALRGAGDTRFVTWAALILSWPVMIVPTWAALAHGWDLYWAWAFASGYIILLALTFWFRFHQGKWRSMRVIEAH
jgi:hypothetical protein